MTDRLSFRVEAEFSRFRSAADSLVVRAPLLVFGSTVFCRAGQVPQGSSCLEKVSNEIDLDRWTTRLQLNWRVRKHWSTFLSYRFTAQSSSGARALDDFDSHRVMVGLRAERPVHIR